MKLYFLRHGEAVPKGTFKEDADRYLTATGRKQARKLGKRLRSIDVSWDVVLTSPFVRSVQTAEIVAAQLRFRGVIGIDLALCPGAGNWEDFRTSVTTDSGADSYCFCGHEPDLGIAAARALGLGSLELPKGGILALDFGSDGKAREIGLLRPGSKDWEPVSLQSLMAKGGKQPKPQNGTKPSSGEKPPEGAKSPAAKAESNGPSEAERVVRPKALEAAKVEKPARPKAAKAKSPEASPNAKGETGSVRTRGKGSKG